VDALFRFVALSYGSRAIGLVITGHLNDGASGLAAIGQRGGITVAQNPSDAETPDMPFWCVGSKRHRLQSTGGRTRSASLGVGTAGPWAGGSGIEST